MLDVIYISNGSRKIFNGNVRSSQKSIIKYKYKIENKYKLIVICFFWFQASSINKDESYTLVVFNTSVLAEIATYKSSISGAWKVEPSTFDLLTRILDPTNKIMAVQFPGVQHSILTTLYTHSQRCNNFVPGPKSKSSGNCKDSNHLIKVLCSILSEQSSSTSAKYWLLLFCNMLFRVAKLPECFIFIKKLSFIFALFSEGGFYIKILLTTASRFIQGCLGA